MLYSLGLDQCIITQGEYGTRAFQSYDLEDIDPSDCDTEIDEDENISYSRFYCYCGTGLNYDDIVRCTGKCEDCDSE